MADGECMCHETVSAKGVPTCIVPWTADGDNIDLFPEGFLWERGCSIMRGAELYVQTPKSRKFNVQLWGNMPYISKDQLHQILTDLPPCHEVGRSGRPAQSPTAARVANVSVNLDHLKAYAGSAEISHIRSKYRNLPDL